MSLQSTPTFGALIGMVFFIGFACFTPLTSRLYKEAMYSFALGCSVAGVHPLYTRKLYMDSVADAYDMLKIKFNKYPHLEVPDNENVVKNFGFSQWNDADVEDEDDIMAKKISIFDGDENSHRESVKQEILEKL
jgi:hypothetical protein